MNMLGRGKASDQYACGSKLQDRDAKKWFSPFHREANLPIHRTKEAIQVGLPFAEDIFFGHGSQRDHLFEGPLLLKHPFLRVWHLAGIPPSQKGKRERQTVTKKTLQLT